MAVTAGREIQMKTKIRVGLVLVLTLIGGSLRGQELDKQTPASRPKTYGVNQLSYYRIAASEFTPLDTAHGSVYTDVGYTNFGVFQRYSSGGPGIFIASPHLPSGALVTYYELDSCDEDAVNDVVADFFFCDILGSSCSSGAVSSSNNSIPCGYAAFSLSQGFQVDNYRNQLTVTVETESGTDSTRFAGVVLGYTLQVSPPPLFADFNDVPTSSPQFRFIEALYNAGITAGCGGGNYCPDSPLTRGQMAVFLAKALGLQWP